MDLASLSGPVQGWWSDLDPAHLDTHSLAQPTRVVGSSLLLGFYTLLSTLVITPWAGFLPLAREWP